MKSSDACRANLNKALLACDFRFSPISSLTEFLQARLQFLCCARHQPIETSGLDF